MITESSTRSLVIDKLSESYPEVLEHVKCFGTTVPSRIGETREILDFQLILLQPEHCIVSRKGFSEDFMHEEILQIFAGVYSNKRLAAITPRAAELITPSTAYGPRTWEQVQRCADELRVSPNSRRAVVYVGRHDDLDRSDDVTRAQEMPCTETWQFHARGGFLNMTVNMRSWDLVWGLCYDVPSFVAIQIALARDLGLKVGRYVHNAGSGHIYDKHYDLETWSEPDGKLVVDVIGETIEETHRNALKKMGMFAQGGIVKFPLKGWPMPDEREAILQKTDEGWVRLDGKE